MRLQLNPRARRLVAALPPVNVYSLAEIALLLLLAVQVARLFWVVVTPVTPLGDWRPAAATPGQAPFAVLTGFDPFFGLDGDVGPAAVTTAALTLYGTRIDEASGRGSAIIAGPDGVQQSYSVGDEVVPGVRLKEVAFDHVVLDRGGAPETLAIVQSATAPATVGGSPPAAPGSSPPPSPADNPVAQRLRAEIGVTPRFDGGRISGVVVRPLGAGVLFRQAQLRDGDVVTAIGGNPVTGPDALDRVAANFAGGGNIPIVVERGGQTLPLSIPVPVPGGAPR